MNFSFSSLKQLYSLPASCLSKYHTLRKAVLDVYNHLSNATSHSSQGNTHSDLSTLLRTQPKASTLHTLLQNRCQPRQKCTVETAWETDFNVEWSLLLWNNIWTKIRKTSHTASLTQTLFYIYNRLLLSPQTLHKRFSSVSDTCWSCAAPNADLLHMLFICPFVYTFWKHVWIQINSIFCTNLPFSLTNIFLGSLSPI